MTCAARLVVTFFAITSFGGEIRAQPCDKFDLASIKLNAGGGGGRPGLRQKGHSFTFTNAAMSNLIGVLSQVAGRKVLDKTGLGGQYDFTLSYSPDNGGADSDGSNVSAADSFPSSLFTAPREQLGLDLQARKSRIELLVFDHIEPLIPN